jgi:hypothetical protein
VIVVHVCINACGVSYAQNGKDEWVLHNLRPYLLQHDVLRDVKLHCEDDVSRGQALLAGVRVDAETKQTVMKEVCGMSACCAGGV